MYAHQNFEQLVANINHPHEQAAVDAALQFLYIDKKSYTNIHLLDIKKEFLLYKFLHAEYRLCQQIQGPQADYFQHAAWQAYQLVLNSVVTTRVKEGYSKFSFGLSEIDLSTSQEESVAEKLFELEQSVLKVGEKKGGVEPGFEAIHAKDVLLHLFKKYPDKQERIKIIKASGGDLQKLHEMFKDDLPKYMVKLDYQEVTSNGNIVVNKKDLKRAKTVQEFYEKGEVVGDFLTWFYAQSKAVKSVDKNCEAVLEAAANDIARLFMDVQDQTLRQERYDNGALKLILKCTWIKGAKTLAPIAGGKNNDHYCVVPVVLPADHITAISDSSMAFLADKLPIFIVQNDRDAIGSQGQNKLRRGNNFMAIDFGHAYQGLTPLLDKLTSDFRILDPDFKNYSIFYDSKRTDIIRGLIKLAVFSGAKIDERVLVSYGKDFHHEITRIVPHSDEKIFDDYINKFGDMAIQFNSSNEPKKTLSENIACCQKIIDKLNEAKRKHVEARDALVARFSFYLACEASAVDLLDCLEKVSTPKDRISLRSPDGTVLLNHLRMLDSDRAVWQMKLGYQGLHTLIGTFSSERLASYAVEAIKSMLPMNTDFVAITQNGKSLAFVFERCYLTTLANIFVEGKIKRKLFPEDAGLFKRFQAEQALSRLFETFKSFGVLVELKALDNQQYALTFSTISLAGMDPTFQLLLKKVLASLGVQYFDDRDKVSFTLQPNLIETLEEKLNSLAHDVLSMKKCHANFADIAEIMRQHPQIGNSLVVILHDKRNGLSLEFINIDPDSKEAQRCRMIFNIVLRDEFKHDDADHYFIPYEKLGVLNRLLQDGINRCEMLLKVFASAKAIRANSVFPAASSAPLENMRIDPPANRR